MKAIKSIAAFLFFLIPATSLFAQNEIVEEEGLYTMVEKMPSFPEGEEARQNFLRKNIKYPKEAKEKGIEGVVYVSFIVNKIGEVIEGKIVRGVHPLLDDEALRVVSLMPIWTPGTQSGKPVLVQFTMPVRFALK